MRAVIIFVLGAFAVGCAADITDPSVAPSVAGRSSVGLGTCQLAALSVGLVNGGLASTGDFAVLEVRDRTSNACSMRREVIVTALGRDEKAIPTLAPMSSRARRRPIVLAPVGVGEAAAAEIREVDGLGILLSGGNEIGYNNGTGCPTGDFVTPTSWRVAIGPTTLTLPNRTLGGPHALTACQLPGVSEPFAVSRQTLNRGLPVRPEPT
ncbi:MAG TPA: hypothetical protein VHW74_12985 [Mycobacteriales bacterium]|jgi:hypothetical protein|nr:hypothetical protein [Mycobacteriales bacterium]